MAETIDQLLAPVARSFKHAADDILDLRQSVLDRSDPGDCVQCYFKIFDVAKAKDPAPLRNLRDWLESNLVVVARDASSRELERLPVSLDHEDMESFCREVMEEIRLNRCYEGSLIELSLRFDDSGDPVGA